MEKILTLMFAVVATACFTGQSYGDLISEFEANPAGADPTTALVELSGMPLASFDLNILSIENDGISGTVDRATNVIGTYDALGLAVVQIGDLENPSFTLLLTENFVSTGTDLDPTDSGTLDVSSLGTVYDSVGVSDSVSDDATLYSSGLGGSSILFNGEFEPLGVFRDASTGDFFQFVTLDFGDPTERVGVFAANGGPELDVASFVGDPTTTSFGSINPTAAVPEPSSTALLGLAGLVGVVRRRK